ncbi:hypothetical protein J7S78_13535 [Klebsiella oxytoca]|uniref:Uncharacterized protein n=1 Tax=Klebsiella oxytoca TaxID=571 RepID=A0AAP2BI89_KLEOX|nr:hypothetical protein [Klebsiella oxytoca]MBQ0600814.1 hypothetical protein [Klebsiella oxytoca]
MNYETLVSEGVIDLNGYSVANGCKCPSCGSSANYRFFESCNLGCLNPQKATECPTCGYHSCDDECCNICEERSHIETGQAIASRYGITSSVLAYLFLARIETDLMVILAKVKIDFSDYVACDAIPNNVTDDIHRNCSDVINFDQTQFAGLPLARDIKRSIFILLGELNELVHWSDSF